MSATTLAAFIARCRIVCQPRAHVPDAELLRRFTQQRDADAFAQLLERYASLVWGVCRRMLRSESDREDAFQATFLALVRRSHVINPSQALGAWLHTVALRVAQRTLTHSRRLQPHANVGRISNPSHPCTAGDIADEVGSRELFRIVDEEIERLPISVRAPLVLCCLEGRTRDEAAESLGCSVAAVKSRLERGRGLLRRRLGRRGVQLPAAFLVLSLTRERIRAALWAKTMQSLHTPAPVVIALAEAALPSLSMTGKGKLIVAAMLLATGTAGTIGQILTTNPRQTPAAPLLQALVPAEQKKPDAPRVRTDRHGDPLPDGAIARLGTVRWRHGFFVSKVAFSPDGKTIAAIGGGRDITLWDAASGKEVRHFPNEGKQPIGLTFSSDGKTLATFGRNGAVSLWNVDTAKIVRQMKCKGYGSSGLTFSPDGKTLAACDSTGTIFFWDPSTGAEQRRIDSRQGCLYTVAFSPDGKLLASGGSRGTGDFDGSLILWDTRTGREERRCKVHTREIWKVTFSPDGTLGVLGLGRWDLLMGSGDRPESPRSHREIDSSRSNRLFSA